MATPVWVAVRPAERLAAGLAMIAGYIDAYGLMSFQTYLSFMSGNTTQTGAQLGQGHAALAIPSLTAIVFFVIGVFAGTLLDRSGAHLAQRQRLALVAVLIAVAISLIQALSLASGIAIAILAFSMGVMNTVLTHIGAQSVNVGFVTGTLNAMASHVALAVMRAPLPDAQGPWDTHARRALLLLLVWGAFIAGALVAGMLTPHYGAWMLLPPLLILLGLAVFNPDQPGMNGAQATSSTR